ncbi:MAG: sodium:solute symporter family protein [Sulfurimonas sp.]|uniref:sodium:solute symporter family protein n=1 Tax=Sulfurimonas sp. TaxID=2022749 RepID=UPI0025DE1273|nr:sodium:solute symporter family protein [Sulfurimonas sp.]MCK9492621.1 sodium:solute symporter family protein [Sulfurimonas sp.]
MFTTQSIIIFSYLIIVLLIGIWAGRGVKDIKDYAVASKSFGTMAIFATLSASFIGGGFSMGNAEKVFLVGISNIVALWGFSVKEILVAKYIAPNIKHYPDAISIGDIMEPAYGKESRIFAGVFGVILSAGILGAQIGAMGYIFNLFLGLDRSTGIILGLSIVIIYSTIGGMRAVVWTDIVQFIVLSVGIPLTLYFGIEYLGGWGEVVQAVPASHFTISLEPMALIALISLFLTFLLGETLVPPYVQRLLIGKENHNVKRGTMLSGLYSIPFFLVTGLIGLVALAMQPSLDANLAMPYVIQEALPPLLQAVVISAIISIIMSSADSFLNAAAIAFNNDIIKPILKNPLSQEAELKLARMTTLAVGIIAVIFALSIDSVLDILIYSYNFWAPTTLVPLAAALLGLKLSKKRFIAGASAGIITTLVWSNLLGSPLGIDGLVVGTLANFIAFFSIDKANAKARK